MFSPDKILLLLTLLHYTASQPEFNIPVIFYTVIRPWTFGAPIKHQMSAWMFANLTTPDKPLIAELDCQYNTTDPPFLFSIFIDSLEETYYFIDGTVCTKSPQRLHVFGFPPFVTSSIVTAELVNKFNTSPKRQFVRTYSQCPGHSESSCSQWRAFLENGDFLDVFIDGEVLFRMSLNGVGTFTLDYDVFRTDNPFGVDEYKPPKDIKCRDPFGP